MIIYAIVLVIELNASFIVIPPKIGEDLSSPSAIEVKSQFVTKKRFYSLTGCNAVAHTFNRAAEKKAPKNDPGAYAVCQVYDTITERISSAEIED
jgi:hypothetical protein